MYKNYKQNPQTNYPPRSIERLSDGACIPFDPANTDYTRFKREIEAGTAEVQNADGQPMSAADANAYVATLP